MVDTLGLHLDARLPDPLARRPDTPRKLAELVSELMAKSPTDRPESAEVVLWRLGAIRSALLAEPRAPPMSVLIVDDDPGICIALKKGLAAALPLLTVASTLSPERVLPYIERCPPDLVVVDLRMPNINGVELCMQLLALPEHARPIVVAMSAEATDDDLSVLVSLGVARFVAKDDRFVFQLCDVIGEIRRSRLTPSSPEARRPAG